MNDPTIPCPPPSEFPDKLPLVGLSGFQVTLLEAIHPELQGPDSTYELDRQTGHIAVTFKGHDCWIEVHDGVAPFMRDEPCPPTERGAR